MKTASGGTRLAAFAKDLARERATYQHGAIPSQCQAFAIPIRARVRTPARALVLSLVLIQAFVLIHTSEKRIRVA